MATLTIPDATYNMLVARAARVRVTLEDFVVPLLERELYSPPPPPPLTGEAWQRAFSALTLKIQNEAHLYPADHVVETDRGSIYSEREDAQL